MIDGPIFGSVTQALHFSYLIEAYEVSPESIMAKVLKRMMKDLAIWDESTASTVDFGGLNPLEVRAQCAMIRAAVRNHLLQPEMWALQARYGLTHVSDEHGTKRFWYSPERIAAIRSLADLLRPAHENVPFMAMDLLVVKHFSERAEHRASFREMEVAWGTSRMTFSRAFHQIQTRLQALENEGIATLRPIFEDHGVIET